MNNDSGGRELCLELMKADSEEDVIALLKEVGYWEDHTSLAILLGCMRETLTPSGTDKAALTRPWLRNS